jgi:MFS family permease
MDDSPAATPAPAAMSSSQRRDLRLLAIFRGASFLGDNVALVTLYLRLVPQGHAWEIAALSIASALPLVVLAAVAGHVVDRVRVKPLLISLGLLEALVCVAIGYWHSLGATLALVALLSVGVAFSMPGYGVLMVAIAGEDHVGRAQSLMQGVQGAATVAGPILGGLLVGWTGQSWPLYLDAMSFALCALGTAAITRERAPSDARAREHPQMTAGLRHIFADRLLRPIVLMVFIFITSVVMVNVAEVFFATRTLHASATLYGAIGASFGFGTIAGSLGAARLNHSSLRLARTMLVSVGITALAIGAVGLVTNIVWVYPLMIVAGAAIGVVNVAAFTLFTVRTPEEIRGRMFAAVNAVFTSGELGSTVLGGLLLTIVAPRTVFQIAGVVSTLCIVVFGPFALAGARNAHQREALQGA